MIKVYIASPYSKGDQDLNVARQIDCANDLMNHGFNAFSPLLFHFQHLVHPRSYDEWLAIDMDWLKKCDCVLRLSGESSGADKEVELAKELKIPVFYSIEEIVHYYNLN